MGMDAGSCRIVRLWSPHWSGLLARVPLVLVGVFLAGLGALFPRSAPAQDNPEIGIPIVVTDDGGGKQVLKLGLDPSATAGNDNPNFGEEAAPPFPPSPPQEVVARFVDEDVDGVDGIPGTGMNVDIRQGDSDLNGTRIHEIKFQIDSGAADAVTFSWDLPSGVTGTIEDPSEDVDIFSADMSGSGSATLTSLSLVDKVIITLDYDGTQNPPHRATIVGDDGTGNNTGWRLLAPPSDAIRGDLKDDVNFTVDSGNLLHTWAGGGPDAWSAATNFDDPLPRASGFIVYIFDDELDTVTSNGLPFDVSHAGEDQEANVTVDNLDQSNQFHLLGNPYNVAFDLESLAGGDLPGKGFQSTVQIWDPSGSSGQWTTVTQGDANDNIAAWQGFFVERQSTESGSTGLTFDASGRQSDDGNLVGSQSQPAPAAATEQRAQVRLALAVESSGETVAEDGVTLFLHERAGPGWDGYEATHLPPPNAATYATVSSPLQRKTGLVRRAQASRSYPSDDEKLTIPLSVRAVETGGTATLAWPESGRDAVPERWSVQLEDTQTGTRVDLRQDSYAFDLAKGDGDLSSPGDARFRLHVAASGAIPVEVAAFQARHEEEGAVRLDWQTASETDNTGFYVQRKASDGGLTQEWQRLGFVESKAPGGTTSEPKRYHFRDADLPYAADSLLYRLRQVDTDGTTHFSREVAVALGVPDQVELQAPVPNPVRGEATLRFAVPEPTDAQVAVYDLLGRQVTTLVNGRLEAERHEKRLPVGSLAPGRYFVQLQAEGTTRTRELTVVH